MYVFCAGCCIYKKHREFDESSSDESDDECENCFGHADHRKKPQSGPEVPSSQSPVPCGSGKDLIPLFLSVHSKHTLHLRLKRNKFNVLPYGLTGDGL